MSDGPNESKVERVAFNICKVGPCTLYQERVYYKGIFASPSSFCSKTKAIVFRGRPKNNPFQILSLRGPVEEKVASHHFFH